MNLRIPLVIVLIIVGIYLYFAYPESDKLTNVEKVCRQRKRYIGVAMIVAGIGLGLYFYYTKQIQFRASMLRSQDCDVCQVYANRRKELRPYSTGEVNQLQRHADSCNTCSKMCFDYVQAMSRDPTVTRPQLDREKRDCAETTEVALAAQKELTRVEARRQAELGQRLSKTWGVAHAVGVKPTWDPFPKLPTYKPQ